MLRDGENAEHKDKCVIDRKLQTAMDAFMDAGLQLRAANRVERKAQDSHSNGFGRKAVKGGVIIPKDFGPSAKLTRGAWQELRRVKVLIT